MVAVTQPAWTITDGLVRVYSGNGNGRRRLWTVDARWKADREAEKWRRRGYHFMQAIPLLAGKGAA